MKGRYVKYGVVTLLLVLVLSAGFASAGSEDGAGLDAPSGYLCVDLDTYSDAYLIIYNKTAKPNYYSVTGREYGAFGDDAQLDGSIRVAAASPTWSGPSTREPINPEPYLGQCVMQLDLRTWTGPIQYSWHYSGYHEGSRPGTVVPCPVVMAPASGPTVGDKGR